MLFRAFSLMIVIIPPTNAQFAFVGGMITISTVVGTFSKNLRATSTF
jgi:hypothetical protein